MTRILVPPGIGDIYWVMVKMQGFCKANRIKKPEIWIDAPNDKKRSLQFVERIPFVTAGGYHTSHNGVGPTEKLAGRKRRLGATDPIRHEAYLEDKRHAFRDFEGFDWFISVNGSINTGKSLYEIETDWETNWNFPLIITAGEQYYGKRFKSRVGQYVVCSFFDQGFYKRWLMKMPVKAIYQVLADIHDATGYKIVLTGADWDIRGINHSLMEMDNGRLLSMVGKTTLEEYFGILRNAKGCIGFPAGNTMLGPAFNTPTVLIWDDFFNKGMHVNTVRPNSKYFAANTKEQSIIADKAIEMFS